jgi:assimilatory nitrate reductase catalytic subunit
LLLVPSRDDEGYWLGLKAVGEDRPCAVHVIVRENLVDHEFLAKHTTGWEAVQDSVKRWDPRTAAEYCGVKPEHIVQAALMFGRAKKAMAIHARGLEHHSKGVENCLALINLCRYRQPGSTGRGCFMITGQDGSRGGANTARSAISARRGSINDPEARRCLSLRSGEWRALPGAGLTAQEI